METVSFDAKETLKNPEEQFMPLQSMEHLILDTLVAADVIDENLYTKPLEVRHRSLASGASRSQRLDVSFADRNEWETKDESGNKILNTTHAIGDSLYRSLTASEQRNFSDTEIQEINKDIGRLSSILDKHNLVSRSRSTQDSYIIEKKSSDSPMNEVQTRLYLNYGTKSPKILGQLIESGADFDTIKLWSPISGRRDNPIFVFGNVDQVHSTLNALRTLVGQGKITPGNDTLPLGIPVEGIPDAFIGQCKSDSSFNRRMAKLFGDPITRACVENNVPAGTKLDQHWLKKTAALAREIAMGQLSATDTSPYHHALLASVDNRELLRELGVF